MFNPIETVPMDREVLFAVPVHRARSGEFLFWDIWRDDPEGDWKDEREIGWRMEDATMWADCPPAPSTNDDREQSDGG